MICSKATSVEWASFSAAFCRSDLSGLSLVGTPPPFFDVLGALAEAVPSAATSARRYVQPEWIFNILRVVSKLEFVDVERQIGRADLVEIADDTALNQRPETFDVLRVNGTNDIFFVRVPNDLMRVRLVQAVIANPFVGDEQVDLIGNAFADEAFEGFGIDAINDAGDDFALAADRADNRLLTRTHATATWATTLSEMPVLCFAADECFINLNLAEQLTLGAVLHRNANAMAHIPSRLVGAGADHPMDLMGAHAFFRVVHQERDLEPLDERIFRVLEDRAGNNREPITVLVAALAEPMEWAGFDLPNFRVAAARAMNAIGPTTLDQERLAISLGLEPGHQLGEGHAFHRANMA